MVYSIVGGSGLVAFLPTTYVVYRTNTRLKGEIRKIVVRYPFLGELCVSQIVFISNRQPISLDVVITSMAHR